MLLKFLDIVKYNYLNCLFLVFCYKDVFFLYFNVNLKFNIFNICSVRNNYDNIKKNKIKVYKFKLFEVVFQKVQLIFVQIINIDLNCCVKIFEIGLYKKLCE